MDEVIDLLEQLMRQAAELSDEFTDEEMTEVLKIFQEAIALIQEGNPQELAPQALPELQESMPSSNIHSFGYDDDTGELRVKFNGKDTRDSGPVYKFGGIPPQIFDLFRKGAVPARTDGSNKWGKWWRGKVPSAGASFYTLIKEQGYPYEKIA